MHIVDDPEDQKKPSALGAAPVVNQWWAEALVDLGRERSRRRHPSNSEPTWQKDGGYEPSEWVV